MVIAVALVVSAQTQKPPVFRSGIDLRQLDVTVLDKQRRPVTGLTAADFTLTEDGVPQTIEAFSFVDVPPVLTRVSEPVWNRSVPNDVETNETDGPRAFVLVVDDVGGAGDLWARREMPKTVATFVNQLNPADLAAVAFVGEGDRSQNFTRDKARLIRAVEWYGNQANAVGIGCSVSNTMRYVAANLATLTNRRKVMVYFGGALRFDTSPAHECGRVWADMVQIAREHNITAYAVDTMGLRVGSQRSNDEYLELSHHTGGRAVINSNTFEEGMSNIIAENSSFYLLAYQPTNAEEDGRFRRVVVKVNRPDVDVVSTRSYWAPKAPAANRPPPPSELEGLSGALPVAQIPLRATAAAFRTEEDGAGVLAVAVGVEQPPFETRTREIVDMVTMALTPDGEGRRDAERQTIPVSVPAALPGADASRYELLTRADVIKLFRFELSKTRKYEVRVLLQSTATNRRGSIYVDVDVPDFHHDDVSMSGVVLNNALSPMPMAPARLLRDVVPIVPTTERTFGREDIVTAFLRIYQADGGQPGSVSFATRIVDVTGETVLEERESVAADAFGDEREVDRRFVLPLSRLAPGEYLLTFEATRGKTTARRDVRFQVR